MNSNIQSVATCIRSNSRCHATSENHPNSNESLNRRKLFTPQRRRPSQDGGQDRAVVAVSLQYHLVRPGIVFRVCPRHSTFTLHWFLLLCRTCSDSLSNISSLLPSFLFIPSALHCSSYHSLCPCLSATLSPLGASLSLPIPRLSKQTSLYSITEQSLMQYSGSFLVCSLFPCSTEEPIFVSL